MPAPASRETERLGADAIGIIRAAELLRVGRLVAFPTETVYGLGADAGDGRAVADLYAAKGRPRFNPLIAHVSSIEAARDLGSFDAAATALAKAFWPGPLTLVVPLLAPKAVCDLARAGLPSVGLRVPDHPVARALLQASGRPVVAPSANRSGHVSPTCATHVLADLDGRIDAIVDGGATPVGVESSIVACLDGTARLLRPGGVPRDALNAALARAGLPALAASDSIDNTSAPLAPGLLASHYAPAARVRLDAREVGPGEAWLGFGPLQPAGLSPDAPTRNLSPAGDLAEAAANLFGSLRELDASGAAGIAVAPIPPEGLGEAIRDRLARAAAERPDDELAPLQPGRKPSDG